MTFHINPSLPLVVVSNFAEAHLDFLNRAPTDEERFALLESEDRHADRTLLWLCDDKLLIVSHPIAHAEHLMQALGNRKTKVAAPAGPTYRLSLDILADTHLIDQIVAWAGPDSRLQIVPYATTPEFLKLVHALRRDHGLDIVLPECPEPPSIWVRDHVDTKSGFHALATRWLGAHAGVLVESYACASIAQAAQVARWFHSQGRACIAKPENGESGISVLILKPGAYGSAEEVACFLSRSSYWAAEQIIVEEFIDSPGLVSPSAELLVPHRTVGPPRITYVSNQIFKQYGEFCGVLVSQSLEAEPWFAPLCDASLIVANRLQEMGYVGHFDIDCIVDASNRVYLLELNARRTGGTHVHEFALNRYGPHYLERVSLLSLESVDANRIGDPDALCAALEGLHFPMAGEERGVLITITGTLSIGQFGVIVVGRDDQDLFALREQMLDRIARSGPATR